MISSNLRVLLLFSDTYSVANTFKIGLEANGCEVKRFSYGDVLDDFTRAIDKIISKTPHFLRSKWEHNYKHQINLRHVEVFNQFNPDLVVVYNSAMLARSTVTHFKKSSKVVFFMGDSPFFTPVNDEYLPCLAEADLILSPDSYWMEQLAILGIIKTKFFIPGSNPEDHHLDDEINRSYKADLVFFGQPYSGAWGYKRALFLNSLADFDLQIYTNKTISRWYGEFPQLKKCVYHTEGRINSFEHNQILNRAKLYPVDANPGLINGMHIRIIDCIASGVVPLAEYRKDVVNEFQDTMLPVVRSYLDAAPMAKILLEDQILRQDILQDLRNFVNIKYSPNQTMGQLLDWVWN